MAQPFASSLAVPVAGGDLHVGVAGPPPGTAGVPVVLAVHGITGSHRTWAPVARHLRETVTLLAPDLRGRGRSSALGAPYGMDAHVEDLVAVLDHVGADRALVTGHSMGGYVTANFADSAPERMAAAVLVDGGLPLPVPAGIDPDTLLAAVLGPSLGRLQMTFPSVEAYRDFWKGHPAFAGEAWTDDVVAFVDYDLGEPTPGDGGAVYRSRVAEDAVRSDGRDLLDGDRARKTLEALPERSALLWARRGLQNEDRPLLPLEVIEETRARLPHLAVSEVPDTNHYFILLGERPAAAVAAEIRRLATS